MTITIRSDSDGNEYQVWAQRQPQSCGIASLWMAESLARQHTPAMSEWELAQRTYQHAVTNIPWLQTRPNQNAMTVRQTNQQANRNQSSFENTFGDMGLFTDQVNRVLRAQGMRTLVRQYDAKAKQLILWRLTPTTPAIVLVGWYSQATTGNLPIANRLGGHFIVAAAKSSCDKIVYLDPFGGELVERNNNGRYGSNGFIEDVIYIRRGT